MSLFKRKGTPIPNFGETNKQTTNNNPTSWDEIKNVPFANTPVQQPEAPQTPQSIPQDAPEHFFSMITDPEDNPDNKPEKNPDEIAPGITLLREKPPIPAGATQEQIVAIDRERKHRKIIATLLTGNFDVLRSPDVSIDQTRTLEFYDKFNAGTITLDQEHEIVKDILPNWLRQGTTLFARIKNQDPTGLGIIGYMSKGPTGLLKWKNTELSDYSDFTKKYPDAASFDKPASEFLDMLKFVQSPQLDSYTQSIDQFKHVIYGKQQEYLDAIKSLNDKAIAHARGNGDFTVADIEDLHQ